MYNINYGNTTLPIKTVVIENHYNAKYLFDFEIQPNTVCQIYYQPDPPKDYSHYFAIGISHDTLEDLPPTVYIMSADKLKDRIIGGVIENDTNEIIFSRFRHDYRSTTSGKISVDGGQDYIKLTYDTPSFNYVNLKLQDDKLILVD
jgi:hypothetical protein